ncbi:MAG: mitochondrial fission protein ELM1 [Oleiphilaceae bacterium]|jgi:mitochondrial fission protein ELM1
MPSLNHLSQTESNAKKLCIWIFNDSRPGHLSQLEGLASRIQAHIDSDIYWLNVTEYGLSLSHLLIFPPKLKHLPKPDLILGTGHRTHISVLMSGYQFKAFTCLIMRPSLPVCLFDAVICPTHDGLAKSNRVFNTFGPINKIDQSIALLPKDERNLSLILIGGISKHYLFDTQKIIRQVKTVCHEAPEKKWLISNSPRTPPDMNQALERLSLPNATFFDYQQNTQDPLQDLLLKAQLSWITPDSMSMIFEALSAGSTVGLFNCKAKSEKHGRIVKQVTRLLDKGYTHGFDHRSQLLNTSAKNFPWEADMAAQWLLHKYQDSVLNHKVKPHA